MIPQGNCPQRPRLTPFQYVKLHHFLAQQDPAFEPRKEPSEVELASRALLRVLLAGNSDEPRHFSRSTSTSISLLPKWSPSFARRCKNQPREWRHGSSSATKALLHRPIFVLAAELPSGSALGSSSF